MNAKAWIEELCEAGYWNNDTHWSCPSSTGTRSLNITLSPASRADYRTRMVNGSATIRNNAGRALSGPLQWRLVVDVPETKVFPDRVIQASPVRFSVPARATRSVSFQFPLGDGLQPGETLHLQLVAGDRVLRSIEVPSQADVTVESDQAKDLRLYALDTLTVTLSNRSRASVDGIRIQVQGPRQVQLPREIERVPEALRPGETITLRIPVTGIAPIDAGALEVLVRSTNGGAVKHRIPFRVQPDSPARPSGTIYRR